jgi:tRNA-2-methylthio-N6-dimethylallyladenosine synthase
MMACHGYREITLLGQNVNAYHDGDTDFPKLLQQLCRIPEILRLRFMTSHPKDLADSLLEVMAGEPKVCPHLHLPVQSGSDRILALMNRGYSVSEYLNRIQTARSLVKELSITTDILVGFPTETEADFMQTINLMETVRFSEAFTYRYSPRPGTRAAGMRDTLTENLRLERLDSIITLQRRITMERKRSLIGRRVEVLPETASKKSSEEYMGKTPANDVVVFPKNGFCQGEPAEIRIEACKGATLWGVAAA